VSLSRERLLAHLWPKRYGNAPQGAAPRRPTRRRKRRGPAMPAAAESGVGRPELLERRDRLAREFVELQWDIGGMTYEMASRDHFRLDVLVRHAARLQAIDSELAEVERILRLEHAGAAGTCSACGALHARGAAYCWQCGRELIERGRVAGPEATGSPPDERIAGGALSIDPPGLDPARGERRP
jgi:hypothetical protein